MFKAAPLLTTALLALMGCSGPATPGTTWTKVSDPQALTGLTLSAVTHGPAGFLAVGFDGTDAVVLASSDGSTWTRLTGDALAGQNLFGVAAGDNGYVAVGKPVQGDTHLPVSPTILASADGRTFRSVPVAGLSVLLTTASASGSRYFAAGSFFHCKANEAQSELSQCGFVFSSPDTQTWTADVPGNVVGVTMPPGPEFDDSQVNGIVAGGPGYVAVGYSPAAHRAVSWTSANGTDWARSADSPSFDGAGMSAVIAGGPGFVAVGFSLAGAAAWTSTDGSSWTRIADGPQMAGTPMQSVVKVASGFVAVGSSTTGATAWTSVDGTTWTQVPAAAALAHARMVSAVADGKLIVVVGQDLNGNAAAIWTSPSGN